MDMPNRQAAVNMAGSSAKTAVGHLSKWQKEKRWSLSEAEAKSDRGRPKRRLLKCLYPHRRKEISHANARTLPLVAYDRSVDLPPHEVPRPPPFR